MSKCKKCGWDDNGTGDMSHACGVWPQPAPVALVQQEPMFWYRPCCNGEMYEGPVHNNSVGGKMLREEKPDEWRPLYAAPQPTPDVAAMHAEIARLRQGLLDCFAAAGGDTDGDPPPAALVSDIVSLTVGCVNDLRADYEPESSAMQARIAELERCVADWTTAWRRECDKVRELDRVQAVLLEALAHIADKLHGNGYICNVARSALAAVKPAQQPEPDDAEYEIIQDDMMVASACGLRADAIREALHYAAQYEQDGPVRIFEVRRHLCSPEELQFALNAAQQPEWGDRG